MIDRPVRMPSLVEAARTFVHGASDSGRAFFMVVAGSNGAGKLDLASANVCGKSVSVLLSVGAGASAPLGRAMF